MKEIKKNQCTCTCSCIPQTEKDKNTATSAESSTWTIAEETTYNTEIWKTDKTSKHHSEEHKGTKPSTYILMSTTQAINENDFEEKILEELEKIIQHQELGEKRKATYMEASVSPSAGTGLLGLGLSMTPFS
ncbi:unnamed protein product, partial [Brugia timori]|uniref:Protein L1 n=1 Tax=Brugia timori TaxID=42155 RepID=A0A0R3QK63_9BILA